VRPYRSNAYLACDATLGRQRVGIGRKLHLDPVGGHARRTGYARIANYDSQAQKGNYRRS
jgi:hypothetical protein